MRLLATRQSTAFCGNPWIVHRHRALRLAWSTFPENRVSTQSLFDELTALIAARLDR